MLVRKSAMIAALTSLAFTSTMANAREGCWYPNESKAAQLLEFDSRLVAGVLRCRDRDPMVVGNYDIFVENQLQVLQAHDAILKSRFDRESGGGRTGGGQYAYEQYLASAKTNSESTVEWNERDCARVASLARVASGLPREELLMLAESIVEPPVRGECQASRYSYGDHATSGTGTAAGQRERWAPSGPAVAQPQLPAASPQVSPRRPVLTSQGAVATLALPAEAEVQPGANTNDATEVQPNATSSDLLRTAIAALQVAAAALQMAMSSEAKSDTDTPAVSPENSGHLPPMVPLANAGGELPEVP